MAVTWAALRKLAKANGIAVFQKSRVQIQQLLLEKGIEFEVPDVPVEKDLTPPKKKGYASWKPATLLATSGELPGWRKRWCSNDAANITKKQAEGWVLVNGTTGQPIEHEQRPHTADASQLTSAKTYREMVLMVMPEELAKSREEFHRERTRQQTAGIYADAERANRDAARASGSRHLAKLHGGIEIK